MRTQYAFADVVQYFGKRPNCHRYRSDPFDGTRSAKSKERVRQGFHLLRAAVA
jgi:hypothetical protein